MNKILLGLLLLVVVLGLAYVAGLVWMQAQATLALANAVQFEAASMLLDRLLVGMALLLMLGLAVGITVVVVRFQRVGEQRGRVRRVVGGYAVDGRRSGVQGRVRSGRLSTSVVPQQYWQYPMGMPQQHWQYPMGMPLLSQGQPSDYSSDVEEEATDEEDDFGFGGF